jgi:hypothetical protein
MKLGEFFEVFEITGTTSDSLILILIFITKAWKSHKIVPVLLGGYLILLTIFNSSFWKPWMNEPDGFHERTVAA